MKTKRKIEGYVGVYPQNGIIHRWKNNKNKQPTGWSGQMLPFGYCFGAIYPDPTQIRRRDGQHPIKILKIRSFTVEE